MKADTMELKGKNPLMMWSITNIAASALSIHMVLFMANFNFDAFNDAFYAQNIVAYIMITALPWILLNLTYSTISIRLRLYTVVLKACLSIILSLILLKVMAEIKPLDGEKHLLIAIIGVYALLSLAAEVCRNRVTDIPALTCRVLVVGNGELTNDMQQLLDTGNHGYRLAGRIHYPNPGQDSPINLHKTARQLNADKVLISLAERRGVFPLQEMLKCKLSGLEILDAPTLYERITGKLLIENINPSWFIFCHGFQLSWLLKAAKRQLDIICSALGLILGLPFFLLVPLAIKLDSPGPIIFRQVRVGKGDKNFVMYKFRTMRQDAEKETGAVWASTADKRITMIGSFLRKSRIDELPQLINVLRGEMSLVGPRPERPEFVGRLKKIIPYYSERHFVKPGVTGWAQVRYPYGASVDDAIEKLRYDLYYIKNLSLLLDFKIILKSILVVLFQKGGR